LGGGCGPILIQQPGILATSYALDQTTLSAISGTSTGVVALGADSSNNLNFSDLPNLSLGSVGGYTYSGTITPGANGYLLGGGNDPRLGGTVLTVSSVLATCLPGCGSDYGLTVNAQIYDPTYVVLTAANTYTGPTVIQADGLALGNGTTLGTISPLSAVTINSADAYLVFNEPSAITFANAISGPGYLEQEGQGTVTLTSAAITYTGGTYIQNGTLALMPGASIASSVQVLIYGTNSPTGVLDISNAGNQTVQNLASVQSTGVPLPEVVLGANTLTDDANGNGYYRPIFGGVISGTGGFVKTGTATQVLSGTNTYSGGTTISQGTLQLGGQGYGAGAATVGTIGSGPVLDNAALVFTEPSAVTFSNVISGTGTVTQSGPGTVTVNATNTYAGGTTINGGPLVLGGAFQSDAPAAVGTVGRGPVLDNAVLVFNEPSAVTFSNVISGIGAVSQQGPGTVTLNATNTYSDATAISGGTLVLGGATIGTVGSGPVYDDAALVFAEPSAVTFTNVISGTGTVTQSGPGTITLNGANTYNGLTEVSAATLIVGDTAGNGASVGGSVQVDAGATLAGYGRLGVGASTLTNNGTVIPGGVSGNAPGTLTETGSYVQGSGGKLLIAVTPTQAAQLSVGGTSSLAGTVTFAYAPGTYVPITYTVLASTGAITGTFGTVTEQGSVPTSLTRTVEYISGASDPAVDLVLSAPGTPTAPTVVAPLDGSLFSEQLASRTAFADARVNTLLAGGAGDNDCTAAAITPVPGQAGAPASTSAGIAALARVLCGAGGWIHADGTFLGANGSVGTPGYHADTAGFLAGIDRPVGDFGLRLGIAVGYDHDWLTDTAGGHGTVDAARFGVYAIQTVGPVLLDGAFLYAHDWIATTRPTGVGSATAQNGGDEFSGGLQASLPVPVSGFILTPVAGARFASVGTGSFVESTSGTVAGFGVSGAGATQFSAIPYARLVVARDFVTASGIGMSPYATVGYQYQAGDTQRAILLTSADGSTFQIGSTRLDRSAASIGVGIAAGRGNWSVFAGYAALVSGNWTAQQVTGGVKLVF
jgi:autotransporter-associated beta strand protein